MNKNEEFDLKIEDMSITGEGIGKVDGFPLFVKDALIGDLIHAKVIKLKKNYGYARLLRIIEPSDKRVEPLCLLSRQCGGCQIQALSYQEQLKFKERMVENNLGRIGGFTQIPLRPIIGMENPYRYRNKAQFPIGTDKNGEVTAGFYAGRTHDIIPNLDCILGVKENKTILETVLHYMKREGVSAYNEQTGKGMVRHVLIRKGFATGELMVCLVINGSQLPAKESLIDSLIQIPGMTSISISPNLEMNITEINFYLTEI